MLGWVVDVFFGGVYIFLSFSLYKLIFVLVMQSWPFGEEKRRKTQMKENDQIGLERGKEDCYDGMDGWKWVMKLFLILLERVGCDVFLVFSSKYN